MGDPSARVLIHGSNKRKVKRENTKLSSQKAPGSSTSFIVVDVGAHSAIYASPPESSIVSLGAGYVTSYIDTLNQGAKCYISASNSTLKIKKCEQRTRAAYEQRASSVHEHNANRVRTTRELRARTHPRSTRRAPLAIRKCCTTDEQKY